MVKWRALKSPGFLFALAVFVGSIAYGLYQPGNLLWWRYPDRDPWCITCGKPTPQRQDALYLEPGSAGQDLVRLDSQGTARQGQPALPKSITMWLCNGCEPPESITDYERHHRVDGVLSGKPPGMDFGVLFIALAALIYGVVEYRNCLG